MSSFVSGAYYYYKTEDGKNYQETILDLKAYTVAANIPIRWILYDRYRRQNIYVFFAQKNYMVQLS
jgi:hypothetical protein